MKKLDIPSHRVMLSLKPELHKIYKEFAKELEKPTATVIADLLDNYADTVKIITNELNDVKARTKHSMARAFVDLANQRLEDLHKKDAKGKLKRKKKKK